MRVAGGQTLASGIMAEQSSGMQVRTGKPSSSAALKIWKAASLVGTGLLAIGTAAGYVDIATGFAFPFISNRSEIFLLSIAVGLLVSFISLIGWAKHLPRAGRIRLAAVVFVAPWLAVAV